MNLEETIYKFIDEHPIWTWVLARLIICVCVCTIVVLCIFAIIALATPFVLAEESTSSEAFSVWLWLPLIATAIWMLCSIIGYVWQEVIE